MQWLARQRTREEFDYYLAFNPHRQTHPKERALDRSAFQGEINKLQRSLEGLQAAENTRRIKTC